MNPSTVVLKVFENLGLHSMIQTPTNDLHLLLMLAESEWIQNAMEARCK